MNMWSELEQCRGLLRSQFKNDDDDSAFGAEHAVANWKEDVIPLRSLSWLNDMGTSQKQRQEGPAGAA